MLVTRLLLARDRMVSRQRSHWRARDVPLLFTKQTRQSAAARVRPNSLCLAFCMTSVRQFTHSQQARRFSKRCRWNASVLNGSSRTSRWRIRSMMAPRLVLHHDSIVTAQQLSDDSRAYRRLMKPLARNWEKLANEFLQPMLHLPRHPIALARFGIPAICPTTFLAKSLFRHEPARALFAGIAAHSFLPLEAAASSAFALVLGLAGHAVGWPIPRGGSQQISNALANYLKELGGKIEVNRRVDNLNDLPKSRAILLDVSVWQFLRIAGQRLPSRYRRRLESFRHAPGIFKIDYALSEPIHGKRKPAVAQAQFISEATSTKLRQRNARLCVEKFPSARLCWSRNKVCSMKRERRVVSTRFGRTAMFRSTAARIFRTKLNRRSNDSRPVFAIASWPVTR